MGSNVNNGRYALKYITHSTFFRCITLIEQRLKLAKSVFNSEANLFIGKLLKGIHKSSEAKPQWLRKA